MISEERLKEIWDKNVDIYVLNVSNGITIYKIQEYCLDKNAIHEDDKWVYETKEEAEFVAKYHCSKTIKFEPPTFEEFMNGANYGFYKCNRIEIEYLECDKCVRVIDWSRQYSTPKYIYCKCDNEESCKQAYYQAVEYAKKLFLGEE